MVIALEDSRTNSIFQLRSMSGLARATWTMRGEDRSKKLADLVAVPRGIDMGAEFAQ
jgi:hypothetical protein